MFTSTTFKDNEILIKNKFEDYFKTHFFKLIGDEENVNNKLPDWKEDPECFSRINGFKKASIKEEKSS